MLLPQLRQLPHLQFRLQLAELQFLQHRCPAGVAGLESMLTDIYFMVL